MKKYILSVALTVATLGIVNAQVLPENELDSNNPSSSAFIDASGYTDYDITTGKGLYFPRTDLRQFKFNISDLGGYQYSKTAFDGFVVYNTGDGQTGNNPNTQGVQVEVKPGFYYFSNPNATEDDTDVSNGRWVRIGGGADAVAAGVNNGEFWTLKGNNKTNPVTETDIDVAQKTYEFKSTAADKNFFGTTDAKNVMFATGKEVDGQMKSIARLEIGEKTDQSVGAKNDFTFVLDVYGKARFRDGIVTSASTYPDYVFDNYFTGKSDVNPNYEFKKLDEVETFIKENNHLPGVTKIDDLAKTESGYEVDNTQLSIQTLEKVEELYLHVIEQQKEIQALKAEIAELKK